MQSKGVNNKANANTSKKTTTSSSSKTEKAKKVTSTNSSKAKKSSTSKELVVASDDIFNTKKKTKFRFHVSYPIRIIVFSLLLAVCVVTSLYCAKESFEHTESKTINYENYKQTKYKVYLKENDFYESDYLDENRIYVASLIDYVDIDFQYAFEIDEESTIDFDYDIIGKLVITDEKGKVFLEKEYTLLDTKTRSLAYGTNIGISENVKIDYGYYNQLANSFKSTYGLDTMSNLDVMLRINKKSDDVDFNNDDTMVLSIPLSEKTVNINFTSNDSQQSNYVAVKPELVFNRNIFAVELIAVLVACFFIYKVINLLVLLYVPKSKYDKYIAKLLRSYDRLIVITRTKMDFKDKNVILVDSFDELLDVRDNLKLPILYHDIVKHQKSCFYIKDRNDIYLVNIKAVDMEDNNEKDKKEIRA